MGIKINFLGITAILAIAFFVNTNFVSAQTATIASCSSATLSATSGDTNVVPTSVWFEWGTNPASVGSGLGTKTASQIINTSQDFSHTIQGLSPNTTYYYRAVFLKMYGSSSQNTELLSEILSFTIPSCATQSNYNYNYNYGYIQPNISANREGSLFSRVLRSGMRGSDVRELQKVLNTDAETRVADTGAGSIGMETDYFGPATKSALIKFQEKHNNDILAPIGLSSGTGILGVMTQEKLKNIIESKSTNANTETIIINETSNIAVEKGEVIVMFPSQYSGKPGTMITLTGVGFTAKDNTIYFGNNHAVEKAVSWNGQEITFKVPSIQKGVYPLLVKNARGSSNSGVSFVVTDGTTPKPRVDSVSPEHVKHGDVIILKGDGFANTGNTILTSVNVEENISSIDGMTISFVIPDTLFSTILSPRSSKFSLPVWVYVVNENGVSEGKRFFIDL